MKTNSLALYEKENIKCAQNSLDKFRNETEKSKKRPFRVILINCVFCLLVKVTVAFLSSNALASPPLDEQKQPHSLSIITAEPTDEIIDSSQTLTNFMVNDATQENLQQLLSDSKFIILEINTEQSEKKDNTISKLLVSPISQMFQRFMEYTGITSAYNALWFNMDENERKGLNALKNPEFDVNAIDENGRTPLMNAAQDGHLTLVKELLRRNADINAQDNNGNTPLMLILSSGDINEKVNETVVQTFLQHPGLDLEIKNDQGQTALKYLLKEDFEQFLKYYS